MKSPAPANPRAALADGDVVHARGVRGLSAGRYQLVSCGPDRFAFRNGKGTVLKLLMSKQDLGKHVEAQRIERDTPDTAVRSLEEFRDQGGLFWKVRHERYMQVISGAPGAASAEFSHYARTVVTALQAGIHPPLEVLEQPCLQAAFRLANLEERVQQLRKLPKQSPQAPALQL